MTIYSAPMSYHFCLDALNDPEKYVSRFFNKSISDIKMTHFTNLIFKDWNILKIKIRIKKKLKKKYIYIV